MYFHGLGPKINVFWWKRAIIIFLIEQDLKPLYFDKISPKITLEGYQLGIDTDLLPKEPSVARGVFINSHL